MKKCNECGAMNGSDAIECYFCRKKFTDEVASLNYSPYSFGQDKRVQCPKCGGHFVSELSSFEKGLMAGMMAGMFGIAGAIASAKTYRCQSCNEMFLA